jgi:hypothetical protein
MSNTTNKENNKNSANNTSTMQRKRFMGGDSSLQGKTFEITSIDSVHYFVETVKAIAGYVGQEYTHGGDIWYMIENMKDYNFVRPQDPSKNANQFEVESWKKQLDIYWKRRGIYQDNKVNLQRPHRVKLKLTKTLLNVRVIMTVWVY